MSLKVVSGTANPALATAVAGALGARLTSADCERFPDGEQDVRILESVRGADLYIIQPTCPPVADNLLQIILLADAARRAGTSRITAVVPYFGYARQDRRSRGRQPVAARLALDLLATGGVQRLVLIDAHTQAIEGFSAVPVEHLSAIPLIADALRSSLTEDCVIVAPDVGAVKLAERYSALLDLPTAFVSKIRLTGEDVRVRSLTGEVKGRSVLIIDDMITTGGTVDAAARAVLDSGCRPGLIVAATHAVLVGAAQSRISALRPARLLATDSVPQGPVVQIPLEVVSVAGLIAEAIDRLHHERSLADLISLA